MIEKKIKLDTLEEFNKIRKIVELQLKANYEIDSTKDFIKNYVPSEIISRAQTLLDTLLNYLMDSALEDLKNVDVELRNNFFEQNFEKKIKEWVKQTENQIKLLPPEVVFSADPRWIQGTIAGGTTFILGSAATALIYDRTKIIWAIVTGLVTIIASAYIFKKGYEKAEPKARSNIKSNVEKFINNAEQQVTDWLNTVITVFSEEFNNFCNLKNINLNGNI